MKIQLVDIDSLAAWEKNPRTRDPQRFEWIQLSLKKFGFVTPVYARSDGQIYSGHQRTGSAKAMGLTQVPVVFLPDYNDPQIEKNLNLIFNLCTNDHANRGDFGKSSATDIEEIIASVRYLPDTKNLYPCLDAYSITPIDFIDQLQNIPPATKTYAQKLVEMGIDMPVILNEQGQIVSGKARLAAACAVSRSSYPAVTVRKHSHLLQTLLNKISMSFDLGKVYGEEIRYNSFFHRINQASQRTILGVGFYHWAFKKEATKFGREWLYQHMIRLEGENRDRWIAEHGTIVIDFGAGRLDNTDKLQKSGITCIPFEPFFPKPKTDVVCYQSSKMLAIRFLKWLEQKKPLNSVFCSSVFNSVPFEQDREYLMCLFQALCMHGAKFYLHTLSDSGFAYRVFKNGDNRTSRVDMGLIGDLEPGLYMGSPLDGPKFQKYHSKQELMVLGRRRFFKVEYRTSNSASHGLKCEGVRPIDWQELVKAIEFEFDLPYPGERRMGLVDEAIRAFSIWCDYDLVTLRKQMQR